VRGVGQLLLRIFMKILRLVESGKIVYTELGGPTLPPHLLTDAGFVVADSGWDIFSGSIYTHLSGIDNLVFKVNNSYTPSGPLDYAGVRVLRGNDMREFYEYYDPEAVNGSVSHVKVVKELDRYYGYGSYDGVHWFDRGYVDFTGADVIGLNVDSESPYRVHSICAYTSEYIRISGLLPGWRIRVKSGILTHVDKLVEKGTVNIKLPSYPFSGNFLIEESDGTIVSDFNLSDVWGGDLYLCTLDVELYNSDGINLKFEDVRHLGKLEQGRILDYIDVVNQSNDPLNPVIRIADYSPFGDWVQLAPNVVDATGDDAPGEFIDNNLSISLPANGVTRFWYYISMPSNPRAYDYKNTECYFYLEVV